LQNLLKHVAQFAIAEPYCTIELHNAQEVL
jgi:hypothetical protein